MKHRGILALGLAAVLSVSALSLSAFAEAPEVGSDTAVAAEEAQTARPRRKHAARPENGTKAATGEEAGGRGKHGGKQEIAEPENAVGKDAAKEAALAAVGVTAEQAGKLKVHVSQLDDGTVVYQLRFRCDGQRYFVRIDATTGAVLEQRAEEIPEGQEEEVRRYGRHGGRKEDASSDAAQESAPASA